MTAIIQTSMHVFLPLPLVVLYVEHDPTLLIVTVFFVCDVNDVCEISTHI